MKKACQWLLDHRLADGGWGENFESCEQKKYIPAEKSQTVNTAWALLGLMSVRYSEMVPEDHPRKKTIPEIRPQK